MNYIKSFSQLMNESSFVGKSELQRIIRTTFSDSLEKLFIFQNSNYIEINMIRINPHMKNKGIGTKIMQDIIEYADSGNYILHLTPSDDFGSDVKRLTKFYKSFGFVMNSGKNKDFHTKDKMIRYPNKI